MIQFETSLFDDRKYPKSDYTFMGDSSMMDICDYYDNLNKDNRHIKSTDDICTPMSCVKLMIDYIPEDFWKKNKISILDPCCGNGNFGAYCKFKTSIDNIYFNELSEIRYSNCKKILNPKHLSNEDFFTIYGIFDMIMMNPPYSGGGNKNQSLSNQFIEKSISMLSNGGYLCVVAPSNWMSYNNNNTTLKKLLNNGSFIVIDNNIKKYFPGVGSSFTVFIWQKGIFDNITKVVNNYLINDIQYVKIPKDMKFIPLYLSQDILDIISKCMDDNLNGLDYRCDLHNFTQKNKLSDIKSDEFCYETVHSLKNIRYANEKQDIYSKWTVIVPMSTYFIPFIRTNVNVTQSVAYKSFDDEISANEYLKKLQQDYVKVIVHLTRYGNFNNIMILKHLKLSINDFKQNEQDCINNLVHKINY